MTRKLSNCCIAAILAVLALVGTAAPAAATFYPPPPFTPPPAPARPFLVAPPRCCVVSPGLRNLVWPPGSTLIGVGREKRDDGDYLCWYYLTPKNTIYPYCVRSDRLRFGMAA